jgi:transcriptional regulator with XRE-family HTH domain
VSTILVTCLSGDCVAREEIVTLVQRVLREGPFSMRQLAEDAKLSYGVLRAWAMGRRTPTPENLSRIADGFERRTERLHAMIMELRRAAGEHPEDE